MKVVIIGNCQAFPLAKILNAISEDIIITHIAINQLNLKDEALILDKIRAQDVIITQDIGDTFRLNFVKTKVICNLFPEKEIIKIPNLFFKGYSPDLSYITCNDTRLLSPLGDYNHSIIFDCWANKIDVEYCIDKVYEEDIAEKLGSYFINDEDSLKSLFNREKSLDINMSDYIDENWKKKRLFHTFNHPCVISLYTLALRVLRFIKVKKINKVEPYLFDDCLNGTIASIIPGFRNDNKASHLIPTHIKTNKFVLESGNIIKTKDVQFLGFNDFIKQSYELYDYQLSSSDKSLLKVRFS